MENFKVSTHDLEFELNDGRAVAVQFRVQWELSDYGVPGSPKWYELYDLIIDRVEIECKPVENSQIPDNIMSEIEDFIFDMDLDVS